MRAINTKNDDLPGDGLLLTGSEPINRPLGYLPTEDKIRIMNKAMHIFRLFDWCKIQGCQSNEMSLSPSLFISDFIFSTSLLFSSRPWQSMKHPDVPT